MNGIDQAMRAVRIHTALPPNTLALSALSGSERLSELFEYTLECVSQNTSLDLYDLLGMPVGIEFDTNNNGKRYIHGLVSEVAHAGTDGDYSRYHLTVTAWPWMLTHTSDCRIFAETNVPDIIDSVLQGNGFDDYEFRLAGSYDVWNYCVQYKETDFDFISRLMEHEGIYFFFEHFDNRHVLVLCDGSNAHNTAAEYAEIPYFPKHSDLSRRVDQLVDWQFQKRVRPGKYVTKDFAFDQPKRNLLVQNTAVINGQYEAREVYEFPGGYSYQGSGAMTRAQGERLAQTRMEALSANHEIAMAEGNVRGVGAGNLFTLTLHERDDQNREYLVVSASLSIQMDSFFSEPHVNGSIKLHSSFSCMPSNVPYRAPRKTRKPEIRGPQTAIVVGPAGEEIFTDQHGRVKLQFHWDRYGQSDENSSCWVRVSQAWAGEQWGSIHIPRIGQEVIVEHIDGDPDRPIVTGRVYNGDSPVPYNLPDKATQSGIKSRSSKAGGSTHFNEIRMEDKKGFEELYIHAERNQTSIIENDQFTSVGQNRSNGIGNDESISIGRNRSEDVRNNDIMGVGNDRTTNIGNNESLAIVNDRSKSIGSSESIRIGENRTVTIGNNESISVGGNQTSNVSKNETVIIAGSSKKSVRKEAALTIARNMKTGIGESYTLDAGRTITLSAAEGITLKTGKASITMTKDGSIDISGKDITINGSAITSKATRKIVFKGKKILQN